MIIVPFLIDLMYFICIVLYIITAVYTYGKLNYVLNYKKPTVSVSEWNNNRNKCVLVAIFLSFCSAIYLLFNCNYKDSLKFTIYKAKEDPLYHQLIEETPDSFCEGNQNINSKIKKKWSQL